MLWSFQFVRIFFKYVPRLFKDDIDLDYFVFVLEKVLIWSHLNLVKIETIDFSGLGDWKSVVLVLLRLNYLYIKVGIYDVHYIFFIKSNIKLLKLLLDIFNKKKLRRLHFQHRVRGETRL